jgi:DNA polymerase III subunit chi
MESCTPEILFYHLQSRKLEAALVPLLEKTLAKGWRGLVYTPLQEREKALDEALWTYSEESFLPHGRESEGDGMLQPILISDRDENANRAQVLFLLDQAPLPVPLEQFLRIVILFDGRDSDAVAFARQQWKSLDGKDVERTYWQQDENGSWQKKA